MRGAALLALSLLLVAGPSLAKRPVPVTVLPFAPEGPARELSDAVELELELNEALVLSSPKALYEELGEREIAELNPERLADALALLEQQALLYGVPLPGGEVVIVLFRTNDAALVWAERTDVSAALAEVPALSARLVDALVVLHESTRLSDEELVRLGLKEPVAGEEPKPAAEPAPLASEPPVTQTAADVDDDTDASLPAGLDRFGRVKLSWAPSFLYYRACQPADPAVYVPFSCEEAAGVPSLEVLVSPLETPLGAAAQLELYPLPFVGLEVNGSVFTARLAATVGGDQKVASLTPNPFSTTAGEVAAALVLRAPFGDEGFGGAASARVGYHLGFAVTDEVTLDTGSRTIRFPLLPTYFSHHALVGAGGQLGFGDVLRVSLDVDALFGPHLEGPVQVGKDAFATGGRARFGVDLDVGAGLLVTTSLEGAAVSVSSSGTADNVYRYTLALAPYDSGQLTVADARFGIGLGYRY